MTEAGSRINTNTQADFTRRLLGINQQAQNDSLRKIASGLRIGKASDDAAGLAISDRLKSLSNGFEQSQSNLQDGASVLQVAEGGLSGVGDSLQRIRTLSVQASNDTLTDADRSLIQKEVNQLTAEIDRQTSATQFNSQPLLSGQFSAANGGFNIHGGPQQNDVINVGINQVSATTLGVSGIDVSTRGAAENALSTLDTAISTVSGQRADIGSFANRISSASQFVGVARENTLSALSVIQDTDFGTEITKLGLSQIKTQSGISALAQANLNPQNVLKLLGR